MPRYRGGPMTIADMTGLEKIRDGLAEYQHRYQRPWWQPAALLERLVREGKTFGEWDKSRSTFNV